MIQNYDMILASGSPRRSGLLEEAGFRFEVIKSDSEEKVGETKPQRIVEALAEEKAGSVARDILKGEKVPGSDKEELLIIGADTIVFSEEIILGKPSDEADALRILMSLSGKIHEVYTGVSVIKLNRAENKTTPVLLFSEKTEVEMTSYSEALAKAFIATKIPMDKAGAYAIQGLGSFLVKRMSGDYHNVVGFPLGRFIREGIKLGLFEI